VLDADGRAARLGLPLECPLCDRAELPQGVHLVRTSRQWNQHTMPVGLTRAHRLAAGTWGRIVVYEGRLRFKAQTQPEVDTVLRAGWHQGIPPEVEHEVQPLGEVRFSIDFLSIPSPTFEESGGDSACWARLLCPECGAVNDGGSHKDNCIHNE
jgi:tellurite methyltransferase